MATNRIYCATGLTGYSTGDLDTIDGADLANNDMAIVFDSGTVYLYKMNTSGGAAESSPNVIVPDDNNDSGNKNWELQSIHVNDITIADDIILATDDVKVGDTLEVVGATQFGDADGTGANVTFYSNTVGDHVVYDATAKTFTFTDVSIAMAGTGAISVGDNSITNVNDIALDSISADDGSSFSISSDWTNAGNTIADLGIVTTVDINGGSIDGVTIGAAAAPTVTDLGSVATCDINGGTIDGVTIGGAVAPTVTDLGSVATCDINGGSVDGITLGAASAVTFTSLTSSNLGQINYGDGKPDSNDQHRGPVFIEATVDQNTVGVNGCLVLSADGNWDDADKDAEATVGQLALATDSGTGANKTLMLQGFATDTGWAWTIGGQIFVGDSGALTQTAPSGSGDFVQVVGYAIAATSIYFNPSPDYLEIV